TEARRAIAPDERETNKLSAVPGPKHYQGVVFGTGVSANTTRESSPEVTVAQGPPLSSKGIAAGNVAQLPSASWRTPRIPARNGSSTTTATMPAGPGSSLAGG